MKDNNTGPKPHLWVCLCLFSSFPSLHMLFEGVPVDLSSLLQTLILWLDLEKKYSFFHVHVCLYCQKKRANILWKYNSEFAVEKNLCFKRPLQACVAA